MPVASVLFMLGQVIMIEALVMLLLVGLALVVGEGDMAGVMLLSALMAAFLGGGLILACRGLWRGYSDRREGILYAALVWLVVPAIAALPLRFSGWVDGYFAAFFEAMSGFTTTGATQFLVPENLPYTILVLRAMLNWGGGLLTIVLAVTLFFDLQGGGLSFVRSALPRIETRSFHEGLKWAMRSVLPVYAGLTFACIVLLVFSGVPQKDALCIALSTLSTGGFLPHSEGLLAYNNRLVLNIVTIFMVIGGLNFTLHWAAAMRRNFAYRKDIEVRIFAGLAFAATIVLTIGFMRNTNLEWDRALEMGFFHAVSALTTTGFGLIDAGSWPPVSGLLFGFLVLLGGCTASTAGGFKLIRGAVLVVLVGRELDRLADPKSVKRVRLSDTLITDKAMKRAWTFFAVYLVGFSFIAIGLSLAGLPFDQAMAVTAASISNVGPSAGFLTAEPFEIGRLPDLAKALSMFGMYLGRLEFITVMTMLIPGFWRY